MTNDKKPNYNSAAALRSFLEQEGLGMRKKFGQNFLINPAVRKSLIDALDAPAGDEVWEIGPGLGAMTAMLLDKGLAVRGFEIDSGFIRILKQIFAREKSFYLVEGDVMKTWRSQSGCPWLLGNLPYNAAAALLADFIEKKRVFSRMVVTVQKEVALRMTASAGSADYSSFSVLCASAYKVSPLILIRRESFYPRPNVDSMGVLLENKNSVPYPPVFYPLVRALFASRRKTVKNNLLGFIASRSAKLPAEKSVQDFCLSILAENNLTGTERAENLEQEVFLSLAKSVENVRVYI
jgi:16S rRNA (adenine1518-N6/adenine1519-N6)-dimethyltransferase